MRKDRKSHRNQLGSGFFDHPTIQALGKNVGKSIGHSIVNSVQNKIQQKSGTTINLDHWHNSVNQYFDGKTKVPQINIQKLPHIVEPVHLPTPIHPIPIPVVHPAPTAPIPVVHPVVVPIVHPAPTPVVKKPYVSLYKQGVYHPGK